MRSSCVSGGPGIEAGRDRGAGPTPECDRLGGIGPACQGRQHHAVERIARTGGVELGDRRGLGVVAHAVDDERRPRARPASPPRAGSAPRAAGPRSPPSHPVSVRASCSLANTAFAEADASKNRSTPKASSRGHDAASTPIQEHPPAPAPPSRRHGPRGAAGGSRTPARHAPRSAAEDRRAPGGRSPLGRRPSIARPVRAARASCRWARQDRP